jgi:hypothetical protein
MELRSDTRWLAARACAALAITLFAPGCADSPEDASLEPPALATRRLTVDGARLLDALGREVVLRGFNAGGRSKMPPFLPFELEDGVSVEDAADAFFARIEALGANVVRLTFSWEAYEPVLGSYDDDYLARYRALLDAADAHGIAAIVDFHQDVFASPFCGDGFPIWAIGDVPHGEPHYDCGFPAWSYPVLDPESDVSAAFDRLWNDEDGLAAAMEAMWRRLAGELADHPAVAGFEVINEPGSGSFEVATFEAEVLPAFYARMGAAIQEVAGEAPIFGGGRAGDAIGQTNHLVQPDLPGFVFSPHYYDALITLGFQNVDEAAIAERLAVTFDPGERWGVPVMLGEFGAMNDNPAKGKYLDAVYDVLDAHRAHGTMWDAMTSDVLWNDESFSVFEASGEERAWAGVVVRAYPRAIDGRIVGFAWSAEELRFTLEVEDAGEGVSEIYLPTRHLGSHPRIRVNGARYRFLRDRELLLVAAAAGASYTVEVTR